MRVLITGCNGQLGRSLKDVLADKEDLKPTFIDIEDFDLTDRDAVGRYFDSHDFDIIVNCAAYTAVDKAETDEQQAYRVNVEAVENLALVAKEKGIRIIQISTDYVFDGAKTSPYTESDAPNPATVYGLTKLKGEEVLRRHCPDAIVIRTAWLYSNYGKNFYLTMRSRSSQNQEVRVVDDQKGSPTYAADLAEAILEIIPAKNWKEGVYHFTNGGETTWFDFAREIYLLTGGNPALVIPVSTQEYGSVAPRPSYSVLDTSKIRKQYGIEIPHWKDSLKKCIEQHHGI